MLSGPEDTGPSQPKRPRPTGGTPKRPANKPPVSPTGSDPDGTTFRPNPARPGRSPWEAGSTREDYSAPPERGMKEPLAPGAKWWERIFFGRVSSGQLAQFCRQFASYLNAGVDYTRTFSSLERQFASSPLGPAVARMRLAIKGGANLEEAMAREPQVFSPMFLSMIRVAEARGGVPETLKLMGNHYESRQRLIRQARSAMIYPVIVLFIAAGVVALLSIFMPPTLRVLPQGHRQEGPASLRPAGRSSLSATSSAGWDGGSFPRLMIGTPFLIHRFYKTPPGKAADRPLDPLDSGLRPTGAQARHQPVRPDPGHLARRRRGRRHVDRPDRRRDQHDADPRGGSGIQEPGAARQRAERGPGPLASLHARRDRRARIGRGDRARLRRPSTTWPTTTRSRFRSWSRTWATWFSLAHHLLGGIVLFIILAVFLPLIQMITSLSKP